MTKDIKWVVNCWRGVWQAIGIDDDRITVYEWMKNPPFKAGKVQNAWRKAAGLHPETANAINTLIRMGELSWDQAGHLIVIEKEFQNSNIHRIRHPEQLNQLPLPA